jgi:CHAD domain-containing protein
MAVPSGKPRKRVTIAKLSIADMALTMETRKFAGQNAARLLGRLAFQMNLAKKAPDSASVHDLRVSIRRFTQVLGVFKSSFPGKETRKIRRRMKKLMTLAGAVRNLDIALKLLSKSRAAEAASLRPKLEIQRKESGRVLTGALNRRIERKSSLKWRTALEAALAGGDGADSRMAIAETARGILPKMAADFLDRGKGAAQAKLSPEKLHSFRIASKKFRYTLELFTPLYGTSLNAWLESVKGIQTVLGDINDCETVAQIIADYKGSGPAAGWLKKRQRRKVEQFSRIWLKEFGDAETVRTRIRSLSHPGQALRKPAGRSRSSGTSGLGAGDLGLKAGA